MLLPTKVHSATTTKTVPTTETAQTWYTNVTYSLILWVP